MTGFSIEIEVLVARMASLMVWFNGRAKGADTSCVAPPEPDVLQFWREELQRMIMSVHRYVHEQVWRESITTDVMRLNVIVQAFFWAEIREADPDRCRSRMSIPAEWDALGKRLSTETASADLPLILECAFARLRLDSGQLLTMREVDLLTDRSSDGTVGKFVAEEALQSFVQDGVRYVRPNDAAQWLEWNGYKATRRSERCPTGALDDK